MLAGMYTDEETGHPVNGHTHKEMQTLLSILSSEEYHSTYTQIYSPEELNACEKIYQLLELNRTYQAKLRQQLEAVRREKLALQERKAVLARQAEQRQEVLREEFGTLTNSTQHLPGPYFDKHGNPIILDVLNEGGEQNERLVIHRPRKWSERERQLLAAAVIQQNREFVAMERIVSGKARQYTTQPSDEEMEREHRFLSRIDWGRIAYGFLPGRSPTECMIRWVAHDHPMINKSSWTIEEDAMLRNIAKNRRERNWEAIALELGTNRTSWQCFKQYRSHLWEELGRRKWTPEEDAILAKAIAMYGERNWQQVAACFDNRTGQQCLHRWTKALKPGKRKGRWTAAEDEALINAFALHGANNWVKVAAHVPGRTDVQCRERWTNVLDPNVCREPWTKEEDEMLLELVRKYGVHRWAPISRELGANRTDNQCWRRFKQLLAAGVVPDDLQEGLSHRNLSNQLYKKTKQRSRINSAHVAYTQLAQISVLASKDPIRDQIQLPGPDMPSEQSNSSEKHPSPNTHDTTSSDSVSPSKRKWLPCIRPPANKRAKVVPTLTDTSAPYVPCAISPLPMLLGANGRHAKFWLTNTLQNMKITKRKRYPETDSIIPLAPSEPTTVSLGRIISALDMNLDKPKVVDSFNVPPLPSSLATRMEASPGLRLLSERLEALYAWPILIGQIDAIHTKHATLHK